MKTNIIILLILNFRKGINIIIGQTGSGKEELLIAWEK